MRKGCERRWPTRESNRPQATTSGFGWCHSAQEQHAGGLQNPLHSSTQAASATTFCMLIHVNYGKHQDMSMEGQSYDSVFETCSHEPPTCTKSLAKKSGHLGITLVGNAKTKNEFGAATPRHAKVHNFTPRPLCGLGERWLASQLGGLQHKFFSRDKRASHPPPGTWTT